MWIKFNVNGELEKLIKNQSEEECRTASQQALYIIKNYYKNIRNQNRTEQSGMVENKSEQLGTEQNELERIGTDNSKQFQNGIIKNNTEPSRTDLNDIDKNLIDAVCNF